MAEASGNPFLRASSAIVEFGVAVSVLARVGDDLSAPPEGLAEPGFYQPVARGLEIRIAEKLADLKRRNEDATGR